MELPCCCDGTDAAEGGASNVNELLVTAGTLLSLQGHVRVQVGQNKQTKKKTLINISENLVFFFF